MSDDLKLADRMQVMTPSATLAVKAVADRLKAEGVDVVDFGPGEPDFNTPENVKAAAHRAIDENLSHYLPPRGLERLRRAVASFYAEQFEAGYDPAEVIVGCGAKSVLYLAAMALVSPGDEVIIPAPFWVSFPEQVKLAGGSPVFLPTAEADGFVPTAAAAEDLVTPRTRAVILCSPSNPTGSVIPQEEMDRFSDLALRRNLVLIYDETYHRFLYDGHSHATPLRSSSPILDRLLLVSSVSKTYAMTGYRVGYALGPRWLVDAMAAIQSHDATHATAVAQAAAAEALDGPQDSVRTMLEEYTRRRAVMIEGLRSIEGITCHEPQGAFYLFPGVTGLYGRFGVEDSAGVTKALLESARIAAVPGEAFGTAGHLRLSYALSLDRIREGLDRIRRAVAR